MGLSSIVLLLKLLPLLIKQYCFLLEVTLISNSLYQFILEVSDSVLFSSI